MSETATLEAKLDLILSKLNTLETRLNQFEALATESKGVTATLVNTFDDYGQNLSAKGVDLSERLLPLEKLVLSLSSPKNLQAVEALVNFLPEIAPYTHSLQEIPGIIATLANTVDDLGGQWQNQGLDIDSLLTDIMQMRSLAFKPELRQILLGLTQALETSTSSSQPAGLLKLLKATKDPQFKRLLGFLLEFAKAFGATLPPQNTIQNQPRR